MTHTSILLLVSLSVLLACSPPKTGDDALPEECIDASFHLKQGGYEFEVRVSGEGSLQQVEVRLKGFPDSLSSLRFDSEPVTGADAADLDGDGYPEVLVYTQSAGSGSYGSVTAYTYSPVEGFRPIIFPELSEEAVLKSGYMGHDNFKLQGNRLIRNFPIYHSDATNSQPSDSSTSLVYSFLQDQKSPRFKLLEP